MHSVPVARVYEKGELLTLFRFFPLRIWSSEGCILIVHIGTMVPLSTFPVFIAPGFYFVQPFAFSGRSAGAGTTANRPGNEENAQTHRRDSFMYAPDATCDDVWLSWPAMQERAIARGTVLVFNLHDSVGNLFRTLNLVMQVRT